MSALNALTASIGILAAIATWLFLGPFGATLQIWVAFIAWACFFHCGGKEAGLRSTVVGMAFGALVGWAALVLILAIPLAAVLGLALWAGIAVGIGAAVLVAAARLPVLSVIPASFYGFAGIAGYTLLKSPSQLSIAGLTAPSLSNPLINVVLSAAIGGLFAYASEKIGGALTKQA